MRRLLALTALAAASFGVTAAPASAECTYAGSGDKNVSVCADSYCAGGLCWTTVEPSCTGLVVECDIVRIEIGPY